MRYKVTLEGDVKAVKSLEKQILFAAKQAVIGVAQESGAAAIEAIKDTFKVRGDWYQPNRKFGVHVRFKKSDRNDLTARVESAADWLIDHETGDDRVTRKHDGRLTVPHVAREGGYGSLGKVPSALKARKILPNASRLDTRRQVRARGKKRPKFEASDFFINKEGTALFERSKDGLELYYTLSKSSAIKKQSVITEPTIRTVRERFGPILDDKLRQAIKTAK